jgi:hypothetical protein
MTLPSKVIFIVRVGVDGRSLDISYKTIEECLLDRELKYLFDSGQVESCVVMCGMDRIAGLPLMEWTRLQDALISNASSILRRAFG